MLLLMALNLETEDALDFLDMRSATRGIVIDCSDWLTLLKLDLSDAAVRPS